MEFASDPLPLSVVPDTFNLVSRPVFPTDKFEPIYQVREYHDLRQNFPIYG